MTIPPDAMPGACHPFYADTAAGIATFLDRGGHVNVMIPRPLADYTLSMDPPVLETHIITLEPRQVVAPAPYVGPPFSYRWIAAVDHLGRWVGGCEVRQVMHERGPL